MFDLIKKLEDNYKIYNSRFERKVKINKNNLVFLKIISLNQVLLNNFLIKQLNPYILMIET